MTSLNLSRRQLVAGIAALPIATAVPFPAPPEPPRYPVFPAHLEPLALDLHKAVEAIRISADMAAASAPFADFDHEAYFSSLFDLAEAARSFPDVIRTPPATFTSRAFREAVLMPALTTYDSTSLLGALHSRGPRDFCCALHQAYWNALAIIFRYEPRMEAAAA